MTELSFPFLSLALAALAVGALVIARAPAAEWREPLAVTVVLVALLASLEAAREVLLRGVRLFDPGAGALLAADPFTVVAMVLFSTLLLLTLLMAPARDRTSSAVASLLALGAGTLATYAANHVAVLGIGAVLAGAPLWWTGSAYDERGHATVDGRTRLIMVASLVLLVAGLLVFEGGRTPQDGPSFLLPLLDERHEGGEHRVAFFLLMGAALVRGSLIPFHGWVIRAIERGPLLTVLLLVNAQVAIVVVSRVAAPIAPATAQAVFPQFGLLALVTAIFVSFGALGERSPRRILARMWVSQSAIMQAALTSATAEGVTGGLLHWTVLSIASTGLLIVCRAVEVRVGGLQDGEGLQGLAGRFPRFAVFFAGFGLAVAGLPGTLGFCSEDLLLHGALQTHPFIAIAMPLATALNAFQIFRLFVRIFLGTKPSEDTVGVPDALPRERWGLTALLVFLILGGLAPAAVVSVHLPAAEALVRVHEVLSH